VSAARGPTTPGPSQAADATALKAERAAQKAEGAARKANRARREAFFLDAAALTPYMAVATATGETFFVSTSDLGIGKRVFVHARRKDMDVLACAMGFLAELGPAMPAEPMLVEVGGNIGTTTVTALRQHAFSSAVVLEPSPQNRRLLRANLVVNDLDDRVRVVPAAASDRKQELEFDVSHHNSGTHRVPPPDVGPLGDAVLSVQAVTLDSLVDDGVVDPSRVGLVWIDAAGHESNVLAGASKLLERGVSVVTAIKHGWPETVAGVLSTLKAHYTDVAELRYLRTSCPVGEIDELLAPLGRSTDVLAVRR
jgi:FkbM family methyltransferase